MVSNNNILITSSSAKIPLILSAKHALKRIDPSALVYAGDTDDSVLSKYIADRFVVTPILEDGCILDFLNLCRQNHIGIVFPTRDGELKFWSKNKQVFAREGIHIVISDLESVDRCLDKFEFFRFGNSKGFNFIQTSFKISDLADAEFYVVKERYGAGSIFVGIRLNKKEAISHALKLKNPVFQPFIQGIEISVDAWLSKENKVKGIVLRKRDKIEKGESKVTTTFSDSVIENEITAILEELKLQGPIVLQAIIDNDNTLHIMECNARFGGASTASIAVGNDALYWSLLEAKGENLSKYPFIRKNEQVRQIRIPCDKLIYDNYF
jgi:carbamoyl-phosphate synthase large subunit